MRLCDCSNSQLTDSVNNRKLHGRLNENLLQGKLPQATDAVESTTESTTESATARKINVLMVGVLLSGGFSLFEWVAGWWGHSLALMTDAGHMLSDCLALGLSIGAALIAHTAKQRKGEVGVHRSELMAALANSLGLVVLAVWVVWEALNRFQSQHPPVVSEFVLVTAVVGLGVNVVAASVLHDHSHHDLNVKGAFMHVLADTVSSAGVIVSAVLIWLFHWNWVDEVVSLCIAAVIAIGACPIALSSFRSLQHDRQDF